MYERMYVFISRLPRTGCVGLGSEMSSSSLLAGGMWEKLRSVTLWEGGAYSVCPVNRSKTSQSRAPVRSCTRKEAASTFLGVSLHGRLLQQQVGKTRRNRWRCTMCLECLFFFPMKKKKLLNRCLCTSPLASHLSPSSLCKAPGWHLLSDSLLRICFLKRNKNCLRPSFPN